MSSTALKLIALFCMVIDHIAEFIPGIPVWFHYIGRLSAPLFFFCMIWGLYYTKNKKNYLIRMYLFGLGMAIINVLLNSLDLKYSNVKIENNIFVTLFISSFILIIIQTINSNFKKGITYLILFFIFQVCSTILIMYFDNIIGSNISYFHITTSFYGAIFGNIIFCEGGFPFVLLAVLLYSTKGSKKKVAITYTSFCVFYTIFYVTNIMARVLLKLETILPDYIYSIIVIIPSILGMETLPIYNIRYYELTSYYWMIIFSLPFMLLYNEKKGKGYKYFFYIFYPLHIYFLYFLGNIFACL